MMSERELFFFLEVGLALPLIERSLLLVSLSHPAYDFSQIAVMPIGERDAHLFAIREKWFGTIFINTANCPKCKQKMEWEMTVDDVKVLPNPANQMDNSLEYDGNLIKFRLPNSNDIMEVMALEEGISKEDVLLSKCIEPESLPVPFQEMPLALKNALLQKMEACDPQSDVTLAISCPECGHKLGHELRHHEVTCGPSIDDWATNMVQDVYLLAKNFGWSENDILEMGSFRRSLYINMLYA
jgi:ssDNA-binding Zn-finger/Zn-ribbon topoisomerase 1